MVCCFFQLTIQASDQGVPPRTANTVATIDISTDQNFPVFDKSEYTVEFPENTQVGATIARVAASDQDVRKSAFPSFDCYHHK